MSIKLQNSEDEKLFVCTPIDLTPDDWRAILGPEVYEAFFPPIPEQAGKKQTITHIDRERGIITFTIEEEK